MPTLRSQYQHVKEDFAVTELGLSGLEVLHHTELMLESHEITSALSEINGARMTGTEQLSVSPSKSLVISPTPSTGEMLIHRSSTGTVGGDTVSVHKNIVNVSINSSDDDRSLSSSNTSMHSKTSGKQGGARRSRRSSRNSTGSRKSSRRSSGSICEDVLNTATVHSTLTTDVPVYTSNSIPALYSQSNNLHYGASFQTYKLSAEQAIMQSLHVPRIPALEDFPLHGLSTLPYMEQAYIPLLMESGAGRADLTTPRPDAAVYNTRPYWKENAPACTNFAMVH